MDNDPLSIDCELGHYLAHRFLNELGFTREPTGVVSGFWTNEDQVLVGTHGLPNAGDIFGITATLADRVQPHHQPVTDIRIIIWRHVHPIFSIACGTCSV